MAEVGAHGSDGHAPTTMASSILHLFPRHVLTGYVTLVPKLWSSSKTPPYDGASRSQHVGRPLWSGIISTSPFSLPINKYLNTTFHRTRYLLHPPPLCAPAKPAGAPQVRPSCLPPRQMDAEMKRIIRCELCEAPAAVRCDSDAAFLCLPCDATVHGANFLVARHVRQAVCSVCHRLDHDRPFTGVWIHFHRPICSSCEFDVADSSSSSSSCISTADKRETEIIARRPRRRSCEERALARLGRRGRAMENNPKASRIATNALGPRRRKMRSSPTRICAAAVARFAMKPHIPDSAKFKRPEARSGAPSKHILASESHLSLALCGYHREVEEEEAEEERWGESSSSSS